MSNFKATNKRKIIESLFEKNTKKEVASYLDLKDVDTLHTTVERELHIDGSLSLEEMREIIVGAANDEPEGELARIIRIIQPHLLPEQTKPAPPNYKNSTGGFIRSSINTGTNINMNKSGLPFQSQWRWSRARMGKFYG